MPQPTLSDVHVDTPLTNVSVAYLQSQDAFVADKVFPSVPVENKSNIYWKFTRSDWNRDEMAPRAPSTESIGSGYTVDSSNHYNAQVYSIHKDVDDQVRGNSDSILMPDANATRFITMRYLIQRERKFASTFFATSVWGTQLAGQSTADSTHVAYWNLSASTPIEDVQANLTNVQLASGGFRPNTAVLGRQVWDVLKNHPDIIDRIKYGQTAGPGQDRPAIAVLQQLAKLFEVDRVFIMDSVYNSAAEGATESNAFIGGKNALLVYAAPSPALDEPSGGYTFKWNGMYGMQDGVRIKSFRIEPIASDRFEIDAAYDMKLVGSELGCFFSNVVQ